MESTRTTQVTQLQTRRTELSTENDYQNFDGNNCSCGRIKDKCCLFMCSTGGYFGLVIFFIYISAARSPFLAGFIFLIGILILPVGLKLCWVKVNKWQMEKQALRENAETVYRLSVLGRENESNQTNALHTLSIESNESVVTLSDTVRTRSSDEGALVTFNRTQLPPAYEQACLRDLPPTYEEAVESYSLQREEPNSTQPVNSVTNEL